MLLSDKSSRIAVHNLGNTVVAQDVAPSETAGLTGIGSIADPMRAVPTNTSLARGPRGGPDAADLSHLAGAGPTAARQRLGGASRIEAH